MPRLSSSTHHSNLSRPQNQEDDAYITLEPGGTSTSTLNTGDSGFEDVRPLQRLDQETSDDGDSNAPIGKLMTLHYSVLHVELSQQIRRGGFLNFLHNVIVNKDYVTHACTHPTPYLHPTSLCTQTK